MYVERLTGEDQFDPYRAWFGIEAEEITYYALLGLNDFEPDLQQIEAAADQRMAKVRKYATGKHSVLSQRLLNQLARVKVDLVRPRMKARYDARLAALQTPAPEPAAPPPRQQSKPRPVAVASRPPVSRVASNSAPDEAAPQAIAVQGPSVSARARGRRPSRLDSDTRLMFGLGAVAVALAVVAGILLSGSGESDSPAKSRTRRVASADEGSSGGNPLRGFQLPDKSLLRGDDAPHQPTEDPASSTRPPDDEAEPEPGFYATPVGSTSVEINTAPKQEPKKPPEPKRRIDPFRDLPAACTLPEAHSSGNVPPALLGQIGTDAPELGLIGDDVLGGAEHIVLVPEDSAWRVDLRENDVQVPIAQFACARGKLLFQWQPEAARHLGAQQLRNRLLLLRSGAFRRTMQLRAVELVEPLQLDFETGRLKQGFTIRHAPDSEAVTVEITELEGPFPPYTFEPAASLTRARDSIRILCGEANQQSLSFRVDASIRRKVDLTVQSFVQIPSTAQPAPLLRRQFIQAAQRVLAQQAQFKKVTEAAKKNRNKKMLVQIEQQMAQLESVVEEYTRVAAQVEALHGKAKLHYRVVVDLHGEPLVLADSRQAGP